MSVTSTRRVSASTVSGSRASRYYAEGADAFVEHIDTANSVAVKDDKERENNHQQQQKFTENNDIEQDKGINSSPTYVTSAIEALAASGVYDIPIETQKNPSSVGVYDNNQSIVRDEEAEIKGRTYLKHFYEKNEILQEIDKLI